MKRLGKQCPGCVKRFQMAKVHGWGGMVRYTLQRTRPGVYECTRCGHVERRKS